MFFKRLVVMIMVAFSSAALAFTPTPEQIAQFKKLPKAQQEALAKQYGIDLSLISDDKSNGKEELPEKSSVKERLRDNGDLDDISTLDPTKEPLKPFGYELFAGEPSSFTPTEQAAVPSNYIIGRGDSVVVTLYGKENNEHTITVDNEGRLSIPNFSPIQVAGLTYDELKALVTQKVKQEAIGLNAFVSMGQLRSMRIMIVGEAYKPGSYVVSPLATVTHGLFVSGGLTEIASLRNIQVKRKGKTVATLDLYDLLLSGDSSGDVTLRSGDVIFVPSVGPQISVEGAVKREGIFELVATDTDKDIIKMFGGFKENAYLDKVLVQRVEKNKKNQALSINFASEKVSYKPLGGDRINVQSINQEVVDSITLIGAVTRPGHYQWYEGQTLKQLIGNIKTDLLPQADLGYGLIVREKSALRDIEIFQFSISDVINNKAPLLHKNDEVYIFSRFEFLEDEKAALENLALTEEQKIQQDKVKLWHLYERKQFEDTVLSFDDVLNKELEELESEERVEEEREYTVFGRNALLEPIINRLKYQASLTSKQATFEVLGQVKYPGVYPLSVNSHVGQAIKAAGGFLESAHMNKAELTRLLNDDNRLFKHINLDMTEQSSLKMPLKSRDVVNVLMHPNWQESYKVHLNGEVKYPGTYTVSRGETLQELLKRAGGLSPYAEPKAAIFTRESIKEQEQEQLEKLSNELRKDIASRSFQKSIGMNTSISYEEMSMLLNDIANVKAIGRLVIDLPRVLGEQDNLVLQDGDTLHVPGKQDSVSIIGEVNYASSHLFKAGVSIDDYLALSGGVKDRANEEQIYVIKANGAVFIPKSSGWFSVNYQNELEPGDTIVVPMDASHIDNLTLWSTATQIFYQLGVGIAAIARI